MLRKECVAMQRMKTLYLIDMSEAELLGDKLHFNQVSAESMGKQVYEQIKRLFRMILMYMSPNIKETEACAISYTFDGL